MATEAIMRLVDLAFGLWIFPNPYSNRPSYELENTIGEIIPIRPLLDQLPS